MSWCTPPAPRRPLCRIGRAHEDLGQGHPLPPGPAGHLPGRPLGPAGVHLRADPDRLLRRRDRAQPPPLHRRAGRGLYRPVHRRSAVHLPVAAVRARPRREPALLLHRDRATRSHLRRRLRSGAHRAAGRRAGHRRLGREHAPLRVPYILADPWSLAGLTSSVLLILMFIWGLCLGIAYRRWHLIGLNVFIAAQATVLAAAALIVTGYTPGRRSAVSS